MVHLTLSLRNDGPALCGLQPGAAITQLGWAFKMRPAVSCPVCLGIYRSAAPAFNALGHLPPSFDEFETAEAAKGGDDD